MLNWGKDRNVTLKKIVSEEYEMALAAGAPIVVADQKLNSVLQIRLECPKRHTHRPLQKLLLGSAGKTSSSSST